PRRTSAPPRDPIPLIRSRRRASSRPRPRRTGLTSCSACLAVPGGSIDARIGAGFSRVVGQKQSNDVVDGDRSFVPSTAARQLAGDRPATGGAHHVGGTQCRTRPRRGRGRPRVGGGAPPPQPPTPHPPYAART